MSGKKILAIVLAVVVGIVVVQIIFSLIKLAIGLIGYLIWIGVAGVVIYALYRGFMGMLTSGKRLT